MKRYIVLFGLLIIASMLVGQPTGDDGLIFGKLDVERLPDMNMPRTGHSVFYVGDELTVVGGHTSGFVMTPTAEYFSDGEWHLMPTVYSHDNGLAVPLDEGRRVLVVGGHERNLGIGQSYEAEMYNPDSHTFEGFGCLDRKRAFAKGLELDGGRVLITGNHMGNDAFEMFDGKKSFHEVKGVTVWRSMPYMLPVDAGEVIVFGAVWRDRRFVPCDTVERLKGEPFTEPLLKEWMPFVYDQNNHAEASFIGDKATGDYSYLIAAQNLEGEVAFLRIDDTVFSLLPTTCPVPTMTEWGRIKYHSSAVANRCAGRAYLVGYDPTGRVHVVVVEYDQQPAKLTLYHTDPLPDIGDASPVLTPDGNLIITGGITDDNFAPFASVWLLHTGEPRVAVAEARPSRTWLWVLLGLLVVAAAVITSLRRGKSKHTDTIENELSTKDDELMAQIAHLMETQRLYLSPDLKVTDVAEALGVHRNAVSACINAQQGCPFNQFVNNYRIQHAKELLCQAPDMKISTVSLESGFANESSFFRIFKAATGMTPKEWAAQQR